MPFDGTDSPLVRLLEADRKLTGARRAAAKLCPNHPAPSTKKLARRAARARESIIVLDLLGQLLHGGHNWTRNTYHDGHGRHCLVGGLEHIRARRGSGDRAGVYLSQAIAIAYSDRERLTHFNDRCITYAEIRAMILFARDLAQQVVDSHTDAFVWASDDCPF